MRREIIDSAVKFLQDPKVQQAPLDKRLAFLQSKGLTQEEIDQAVKESNTNSANSSAVSGTGNTVANTSAAQPAYAPAIPPMVPAKVSTPTTWKDVSLALVGMAGVGYALKYAWVNLVMPYLDFPDAKTVRNDTNLIQSSLENNSSTISLVKNQTTDLMAAMESHANGVSNTLDEINTLLSSLKASDAKKNDDIVSIQAELDELKSTFPKLLEQSKTNQSQMLAEVQAEIKSLKNLLMNRRLPSNNSAPNDFKSNQSLSNDANSQNIHSNGSNQNSAPQASSNDSVNVLAKPYIPASVNGIAIPSTPAIPAWQLEALQKNQKGKSNESSVNSAVNTIPSSERKIDSTHSKNILEKSLNGKEKTDSSILNGSLNVLAKPYVPVSTNSTSNLTNPLNILAQSYVPSSVNGTPISSTPAIPAWQLEALQKSVKSNKSDTTQVDVDENKEKEGSASISKQQSERELDTDYAV